MKWIPALGLLLAATGVSIAQPAPAHLQWFGFAIVDCFWDDPHDSTDKNTYIDEVDSFSNTAQLCVYSYTDDIRGRVAAMNDRCMKPMLGMETVFFSETVGTAPYGGPAQGLTPGYRSQWQTFLETNRSILDTAGIACFYIMDEPYWRGVTFEELDTVCSIIKTDFPDVPVCFIEAYTMLSSMQVPVTADWIGFDRYGHLWPHLDPVYLADVETLKSRISAPHQKIILIIDDQWLQMYGDAGVSPESITTIVNNYYELAKSDTLFIGLIGYLWPGGLDGPDHLGLRDLPQNVIDANIRIGRAIKANNDPCRTSGIRPVPPVRKKSGEYPDQWFDLWGCRITCPTHGVFIRYLPDGSLIKQVTIP